MANTKWFDLTEAGFDLKSYRRRDGAKLFILLPSPDASQEIIDRLFESGFKRSGNIIVAPQNPDTAKAIISVPGARPVVIDNKEIRYQPQRQQDNAEAKEDNHTENSEVSNKKDQSESVKTKPKQAGQEEDAQADNIESLQDEDVQSFIEQQNKEIKNKLNIIYKEIENLTLGHTIGEIDEAFSNAWEYGDQIEATNKPYIESLQKERNELKSLKDKQSTKRKKTIDQTIDELKAMHAEYKIFCDEMLEKKQHQLGDSIHNELLKHELEDAGSKADIILNTLFEGRYRERLGPDWHSYTGENLVNEEIEKSKEKQMPEQTSNDEDKVKILKQKEVFKVIHKVEDDEESWEKINEVLGQKLVVPGYEDIGMFIHNCSESGKKKYWKISEEETGLALVSDPKSTKKEALEELVQNIPPHDKLEALIQEAKNRGYKVESFSKPLAEDRKSISETDKDQDAAGQREQAEQCSEENFSEEVYKKKVDAENGQIAFEKNPVCKEFFAYISKQMQFGQEIMYSDYENLALLAKSIAENDSQYVNGMTINVFSSQFKIN